jgi:hypothetical protein
LTWSGLFIIELRPELEFAEDMFGCLNAVRAAASTVP